MNAEGDASKQQTILSLRRSVRSREAVAQCSPAVTLRPTSFLLQLDEKDIVATAARKFV